MKKMLFIVGSLAMLTSCATVYQTDYNINNTTVEISNNNFDYLGSFKGMVSEKRTKATIKNMEGLVSRAKTEMMNEIEAKGIEMNHSKVLINMNVDIIKNYRRITVTVSADLIEFDK